jgi:hypothetical protein
VIGHGFRIAESGSSDQGRMPLPGPNRERIRPAGRTGRRSVPSG